MRITLDVTTPPQGRRTATPTGCAFRDFGERFVQTVRDLAVQPSPWPIRGCWARRLGAPAKRPDHDERRFVMGAAALDLPISVKQTRRVWSAARHSPFASFSMVSGVHSPSHVHVLAAAVWDYDDDAFLRLRGPAKDLEMVRELFSATSSSLGVYPDERIETLANPTVEQLRSAVIKYAMDRSAKGEHRSSTFPATERSSQTTSLGFA